MLHLAHKNDGLASPESAGLKGQKVKVMDYLLPIIGVHQFACLDLRTHRAVLKEFYDQD